MDYDADGNVVRKISFGDANCDSVLNNFDINAFVAAALDAEEEAPHDYCVAAGLSESGSPSPCQACWDARETWGDLNGDGVFNNFDLDPFVSVLVGGASSPSYRTYVWDAENRLIEVHPAHGVGSTYSPANNDERWRYVYDYLGRRVEKHHDKYVSGSWVTQSRTRFVYDGWNLIEELNVPTSGDPTVLRQYTWGLDLSGQSGNSTVGGLHGAGGIGGLLSVYDTNGTTTGENATSDDKSYVFLYDANGNVGQLVEWATGAGGSSGMAWSAGRLVAKYEYDPYGNIVGPDADNDGNIAEEAGPYAAINPFRFSTKFFDAETGLYYYGYRYYSPRLGRWISRDPIGEADSLLLYGFARGSPANRYDVLGLLCAQDSPSSTQPNTPAPTRKCTGEACKERCKKSPGSMSVECEVHNEKCSHCICDCSVPSTQPGASTQPTGAAGILRRCRLVEEEHHVKRDILCPKSGECKGAFRRGFTECQGDIEHLWCLHDALKKGECRGNQACVDELKRAAEAQASACALYGTEELKPQPGEELPESYNIQCLESDRELCKFLFEAINKLK
ncbi:MAG: hypothetical protein IPM64_11450 [Phycisphaerales bacterium]|nr:hypothetical protein [Phycisphaerales bacterium]